MVEAPLPLVLTVDGSAAPCRPRNAYRLLRFQRAATPSEQAADGYRYADKVATDSSLTLQEWNLAYVGGDASRCGLSGSPTKVKKVDNVIFQAKESKRFTADDEQIKELVGELLANHTIG